MSSGTPSAGTYEFTLEKQTAELNHTWLRLLAVIDSLLHWSLKGVSIMCDSALLSTASRFWVCCIYFSHYVLCQRRRQKAVCRSQANAYFSAVAFSVHLCTGTNSRFQQRHGTRSASVTQSRLPVRLVLTGCFFSFCLHSQETEIFQVCLAFPQGKADSVFSVPKACGQQPDGSRGFCH